MGGSSSTNTQEIEKRIIPPHEFGVLNDIVLLTPFKMPLKIDKPNNSSDILSLFNSAPKTSEIFVPFTRVEKTPYYLQES